MVSLFLYYILFSSAVLVYGVGVSKCIILCDDLGAFKLNLIKILLTLVITSISAQAICIRFLVPLNLSDIYPLVAAVVLLVVAIFFETMIRITTNDTTSDFGFTYLVVLLALNESLTMLEAIFITLASLISFILLLLVTHVIKCSLYATKSKVALRALIMVVLAILLIVISSNGATRFLHL